MHAPRALLEGLFDYSGLFPPSELQMRPAVEKYAEYRRGRQSWLLGRFVLPIVRLEEFERAFGELTLKVRGADAWRLSILGGRNLDVELRKILEFNRRCGDVENGVRIESFELKLRSVEEVDRDDGTVTLRVGDARREVLVAPEAEIKVGDFKATFEDLEEGQRVRAALDESRAQTEGYRIEILDKGVTAPAKVEEPPDGGDGAGYRRPKAGRKGRPSNARKNRSPASAPRHGRRKHE